MRKRSGSILDRTTTHSSRVATPRADVFAAPARGRQFPVWRRSIGGHQSRPDWFFVAAHGGAGTSLLSRLTLEEARSLATAGNASGTPLNRTPACALDAGQTLPNPRLEPTGAVVVVCRTTMAGLTRARELAAQYLAGAVPNGLRILGLVTIADQPGRLPKELAAAQNLLAGAYANTWRIPFIPAYRLFSCLPSDAAPATHPSVADVFAAIRSVIDPKGQL